MGLHAIAQLARDRAKVAIGAVAAAGLIWAVAANHADLNVRNYTLPEQMGRYYLEPLEPGAVLVVRSDNVVATSLYAQRIGGIRPDVVIVSILDLKDAALQSRLVSRLPFLRKVDASALGRDDLFAAFANVNGMIPGHPIYFEYPPPSHLLRPEIALAPAGPMKRIVPRGRETLLEWQEPIPAEALARMDRRPRAQFNEYRVDGIRVRPETFEHRFLLDLVRARQNRADWEARAGTAEAFRRSAEIYEGILALDPDLRDDRGIVYNLAGAYFGMKRYDLAEPWLKRALDLELPPAHAAQVCGFLAVICRTTNRADEAARWAQRAQGSR